MITTRIDNQAREKWQKEAKKAQEELSKAAVACLQSDLFKNYRERYLKLRLALINEMLSCDETEPMRYALQMNSYSERIKALGVLLDGVEIDSKRSEA